jgi:NAD(P)H-hydrate epimerase
MSGAAVLSGLGALRGGAGLVRVYTPASVHPIVAASEACFMAAPLAETEEGRISGTDFKSVFDAEALRWPTVFAAGPGLGQGAEQFQAVMYLMRVAPQPIVLDADALNNLAFMGPDAWSTRRDKPTILTPHPGEMLRLWKTAEMARKLGPMPPGDDDAARLAVAHQYARFSGATVVLKGHHTIVASEAGTFVNTTGNPGMAAGGMGDVLTGLIAALIGQGMPPFDACRLAVYSHGYAADRVAERKAPVGYLAREVADELPAALAAASRPKIGFR